MGWVGDWGRGISPFNLLMHANRSVAVVITHFNVFESKVLQIGGFNAIGHNTISKVLFICQHILASI